MNEKKILKIDCRPTPADNIQIPLSNWTTLLKNLKDCPKKKTFYFFGWTVNYSNESLQSIAGAYLTRSDERFIVFDWSSYNKADYATVGLKVHGVIFILSVQFIGMTDTNKYFRSRNMQLKFSVKYLM
jgi:hypothetical protein